MAENVIEHCQQVLNLSVVLEKKLPPLTHTFSHFHFIMHPLQCRVIDRNLQIQSMDNQCWYHVTNELPGGISAPIKSLLELEYEE